MIPILRPTDAAIMRAADRLMQGSLVCLPTETVYGLIADSTNEAAIARIYEVKNRPIYNPLIIHVSSLVDASNQGIFSRNAILLAKAFWPGPLTLVVPTKQASCCVTPTALAGSVNIALRCPANPVFNAVMALVNVPLAGPSANISGRLSTNNSREARAALPAKGVSMIIDGGSCNIGVESTIIGCFGNITCLLRPGKISARQIMDIIGCSLDPPPPASDISPLSPGRLSSHYAPKHPLRMNACDVASDEALLAFGVNPLSGAKLCLNLSPHASITEAANNLFAMLHKLSEAQVSAIAVMPIFSDNPDDDGLLAAINDRLTRAAASIQP